MRCMQRFLSFIHFASLPVTWRTYRVTILRVKVAVDVVLFVPETVHSDPMTQGLHLFPYMGVSLFDPGFDLSLLLDVGGRLVPIAETGINVSDNTGLWLVERIRTCKSLARNRTRPRRSLQAPAPRRGGSYVR